MELGSDFELSLSELERQEDSVFQYLQEYNTIYMDSGRSAAAVLNSVIPAGTVLLPDYICESVIQAYETKFRIRYYHICKDFSVDTEDLMKKLDDTVTAVYLMHYFGMLQDDKTLEIICACKKKFGFTIIEDTTHSIFTRIKTAGDYCICSLRKWFPVPDGGVLYSDTEPVKTGGYLPVKNPSEKLTAMLLKKLYIDGKLECNELYREIFVREEHKLDDQNQVYQISDIAGCLLKYFSVTELKKKRIENYQKLLTIVQDKKMQIPLTGKDFVPLSFPVYAEDRDEFRRYLAEHHVYCAVHWPLERTELFSDEETAYISRHIISLPIDQRYGPGHMQYLWKLIEDYK